MKAMIHFPNLERIKTNTYIVDEYIFDDGLFAQYYYFPLFKQLNKSLKFSIPTKFIQHGKRREQFEKKHLENKTSNTYMTNAFLNDSYSSFMNWEEVNWLDKQDNVEIIGHSHYHEIIAIPQDKSTENDWRKKHLNLFGVYDRLFSTDSKLANVGYEWKEKTLLQRTYDEFLNFINKDTELMIQTFETYLNKSPTTYCYPYNKEHSDLTRILKEYGLKNFLGKERISLD